MGIVSYEVKKSFNKKNVIDNFSFVAKEGRLTLLLGPNGCGKTTWIRIALGHEFADAGEVTFDDKPIKDVRSQMAVVFDEPPIYPNLSGYDNLQILSGVHNIKTEYVKKTLADIKLTNDLMKKKAKAFSLGQRHRLAVACALIRQAKYIIMDEPAVGLDYESWEMVKKLLKKELEKGCTILVTGHNYDMMGEIVDDLIIVANGVVTFEGSFEQLKSDTGIIVKIKAQTAAEQMNEFGFEQLKSGVYQKNYKSKEEFDKQLLEMQQSNVLIEQVDFQVPGLKEMYKSIIEDEK
jgi:ABC-type multidrug transport system ATPase subunit